MILILGIKEGYAEDNIQENYYYKENDLQFIESAKQALKKKNTEFIIIAVGRIILIVMAEYKVTLKTPSGEHSFSCDEDISILDQAEDEGIDLPYNGKVVLENALMEQLNKKIKCF